jgi:hypothetical protein
MSIPSMRATRWSACSRGGWRGHGLSAPIKTCPAAGVASPLSQPRTLTLRARNHALDGKRGPGTPGGEAVTDRSVPSCATRPRHPHRPIPGLTSTFVVGKGGFEPPASASRTLRANQAALLPVKSHASRPASTATEGNPVESARVGAASSRLRRRGRSRSGRERRSHPRSARRPGWPPPPDAPGPGRAA